MREASVHWCLIVYVALTLIVVIRCLTARSRSIQAHHREQGTITDVTVVSLFFASLAMLSCSKRFKVEVGIWSLTFIPADEHL